MPGTAICSAAVLLVSDLISTVHGGGPIIPVNTVTSLIGIPVVLWIILGKNATGGRR